MPLIHFKSKDRSHKTIILNARDGSCYDQLIFQLILTVNMYKYIV